MTKKPFCASVKIATIAGLQSLLLVAATGAAHADERSPDAASFIQHTFDRSFADLGNASLGASERRRRFHEAVLNLLDVRNTAYYTLGSFAAQAPAADMDGFIRAFREYIAASYEEQLGGEARPFLKVIRLEPSGTGDFLVDAALCRPNADATPVTFRVRNPSNGKLAVVDAQVGGIWMSMVARAEFASFLYLNSGNVAKLTARLNAIAENIRTRHQG